MVMCFHSALLLLLYIYIYIIVVFICTGGTIIIT